jgi:iron complex transport system substrate-binding protein
VTIARAPQSLISLAPSNTEILFALGLGSKVVAVGSSFDDYPPEARALPKVAEPDVTKPNLEKIVALAPDLILITGGDPLPLELINRLEGLQLTVLVLYPRDIEGILQDIELIGTATGASKEAQALTTSLRGRLDAVLAKARTATTKPKVFYEVDATNPARPFTAGPGSFIDAMLTLVGASNVAAGAKSPWAEFSAEELVRQDPEIIILGDANYGVTVDSVKARPGWSTLTAVKKGAIYPIDDNLVSRPGPRLVEGLEALARIVHPELFR